MAMAWIFFSIGWIWSQYNISGFHIPVSVVVETQEVVPKPCNLFFIGQLWVGPPASSLSSMFIPAGARSYHLLHQEHLSLPGCLQLPDHEHHLGQGPPITETSDHSDMQIPASWAHIKTHHHNLVSFPTTWCVCVHLSYKDRVAQVAVSWLAAKGGVPIIKMEI